MSSTNETEPETWLYDETNKDYAYDYHKAFLSMLNSVDAPCSHWLLKSSDHALYPDTFSRHYPNAKMIMPHRHRDHVLPSACRTVWGFNNIFFHDKNFGSSKYIEHSNISIHGYINRTHCEISYLSSSIV
ncbi:unnamed protein product [Rotaria socialis]|uniref:Uncharacterized protein n=1 Tax=Rotaria socialis TaxID=392032 RepID=A0A821RG12_9BILA|nr:unnamed protein product [Rotaria socialis]CAF4517581.1 unnamed protein product [Rotaria socialis]CAF4841965.1 unnamed protein product [Rotaria socialis]